MSGRLLQLGDKSDDDDDFGDPAAAERRGLEDSRARLATLFNSGHSQLGGKSVEEALSYSAPKEPSTAKASNTPADENATGRPVFSSAVYAFVLDGEKYQPQGKVGLALIHAKGGKSKLILYLASKKLLCQSLITEDYVVTVKDLYVIFVDQYGRSWSVAFDDRTSLNQFTRVLVATVGALKASRSYFVDLQTGEGDAISPGDSVELTSLHYSVDEGIQLAEYRSEEALRLKVGRAKAAEPWENALLGMRRHGQRVIAAETGGSQKLVAEEQAMEVVVVTLKRVKFADASKNDAARSARAGTPNSAERAPSNASSAIPVPVDIASTEGETPAEPPSPPPTKPADSSNSSTPLIEEEPAKKPSDIRSRMARIGQPLVALAAPAALGGKEGGGGGDQQQQQQQQQATASSSAAQSPPSSPAASASSAVSDETPTLRPAILAKPLVAEPKPAPSDSVNKPSSVANIPTADQALHAQPMPFFFPYGANPTAQGFPSSMPHFSFVPMPMQSAQPSLGDAEERIVAKVNDLHERLLQSIASEISKTVSETVSAQVSSLSAAIENKQVTTSANDDLLASISNRIEELEKKIDGLQALNTLRQSVSSDDSDRRVKRIMSRLYKSAVEAFPHTEAGYSAESIHTTLMTLIKEATLTGLEPSGPNAPASDIDVVYAIVNNCVDTVAN